MKKTALALLGVATMVPLLLLSGCAKQGTKTVSPTEQNTISNAVTQPAARNTVSSAISQSAKDAVSTKITKSEQTAINAEMAQYHNTSQSFDAENQVPKIIEVEDAKGHKVAIDVSKHPVFFFAYWCPHCLETMKDWAKLGIPSSELPIFISTGTQQSDTMQSVIQKSKTDIQGSGLNYSNIQVYYLMGSGMPYVSEYPVIMYHTKDGKAGMNVGTPTSASAWLSVFKLIYG